MSFSKSFTFHVTVQVDSSGAPPELFLSPWMLSGSSPPLPPVDQTPESAPPAVKPVARTDKATFLSPTRCPHGHHEPDSDLVLRYRGSNSCVHCSMQDPFKRRQHSSKGPVSTNGQTPAPTTSTEESRPALPPHLAATCFLSPIVCSPAAHRYRETPYSLRYLADETCVQCTTSSVALAGD